MYWILATVLLAVAVAILAYLYGLYYLYDQTLKAYIPAKILLDQWQALRRQLPNATVCMVEVRAVRSVEALNATPFLRAPDAFLRAADELRRLTLMHDLRAIARLAGEDFYYSVALGNESFGGTIDWAKPLTLIKAVEAIGSASIEAEGLDGVEKALRDLTPFGFSLEGYLYGVLKRRGGAFVGQLGGVLTIYQDYPLRCLHYYLNKTFYPSISLTLYLKDNATEIYVFVPINIKK